MRPLRTILHDPAVARDLAGGLDEPPAPHTAALAAELARVFGPATSAIIHYGSHAHQSDARPESAHDFFIIVDQYRAAYASLHASGASTVSPRLASTLAHVLPPNVVAVALHAAGRERQAKCAVLSLRHLRLAAAGRTRDHFTQGRLFQHVQLAWTRSGADRSEAVAALGEIRARTFAWGRPYLPREFTTDEYCRVLLETSYSAEVRPEGGERIGQLLAAQRRTLVDIYDRLLQTLTAERILVRDGKVYRQIARPGPLERASVALYFKRSKLRATARWFKYIALFDDWLDYIVLKISRRSGVSVVLTERERRWPLIFLWPKALRYLRSRPQRRA
ncbi:MAG TPA: hypothetical protein VFK13_10635 [Gemmatimonadaceae bacterium]|nr:hypothetical protein [Gemmatimonadaceae bacterium]